MEFQKMIKGTPDWHNKYNNDFENIGADNIKLNNSDFPDLNTVDEVLSQLNANKADVIDAESSYSNGIFKLTTIQNKPTGRYILRFVADVDYTENDIFEIFGNVLSVVTTTNPLQPAPSGIFATNAVVSFDIDGLTAFYNIGGTIIPPEINPPENVRNFEIKHTNLETELILTWRDSIDTMGATWSGTRILRKEGSFPTSEYDGTLVVDNKIRDQYASSGFVDSGLAFGVRYFYQAFPYSTKNIFNTNINNRISTFTRIYFIKDGIQQTITTGEFEFIKSSTQYGTVDWAWEPGFLRLTATSSSAQGGINITARTKLMNLPSISKTLYVDFEVPKADDYERSRISYAYNNDKNLLEMKNVGILPRAVRSMDISNSYTNVRFQGVAHAISSKIATTQIYNAWIE